MRYKLGIGRYIALMLAILMVIVLLVYLSQMPKYQVPANASADTTSTTVTNKLPSVDITSVSLIFDNLTYLNRDEIVNTTQINETYFLLPVNTTQTYGTDAPAGSNMTINVINSFTFNGQVIEFIPETPGFTVLNSTYIYSNEIAINVSTSTTALTTSISTTSVSSSSTTSISSTTTSSTSTSSVSSTTQPTTSSSTTVPTTTIQTTSVSPYATVITPGTLVGYTVHLGTPPRGYYGNLKLVEVINDVDKTGILISNSS